MNQEPIYEWMDYAIKQIQKRLKPDIDIDDWMWGKDYFQFVFILNASSREKAYTTDPYAFYYHEGEGTAHQQIDEWIEDRLYRFLK